MELSRVSGLITQPVGEEGCTGNILAVGGLLQVIESKASPGLVLFPHSQHKTYNSSGQPIEDLVIR